MCHAGVLFAIIIFFVKVNFIFQPETCDGCHDLMQKAMIFKNVPTAFCNINH